MTKKNATKRAARARQDKFGGKFLHHHRLLTGAEVNSSGIAEARLTLANVIAIARERAHVDVIDATDRFGTSPFVYVIVDGSDRLGATVAARCMALEKGITVQAALDDIAVEVQCRHARKESAPFAGLMPVNRLGTVLREVLSAERIDITVGLVAQFSTPPPTESVHVLAVATGELEAAHACALEPCWCGHPVIRHDDTGRCTWVGVPDLRPIAGLSKDLADRARELGIPMQCPCAGPAEHYDTSGQAVGG